MFAQSTTQRSFSNERHSSSNAGRNTDLNIDKIAPAETERIRRENGPDPMTYVISANDINNQSKMMALKSVFRNNHNAPFNSKTERFVGRKAVDNGGYLDPFEISKFGKIAEKKRPSAAQIGDMRDKQYWKAQGIENNAKKPGPADYDFNDPWAYDKSRSSQLKKLRDDVY